MSRALYPVKLFPVHGRHHRIIIMLSSASHVPFFDVPVPLLFLSFDCDKFKFRTRFSRLLVVAICHSETRLKENTDCKAPLTESSLEARVCLNTDQRSFLINRHRVIERTLDFQPNVCVILDPSKFVLNLPERSIVFTVLSLPPAQP